MISFRKRIASLSAGLVMWDAKTKLPTWDAKTRWEHCEAERARMRSASEMIHSFVLSLFTVLPVVLLAGSFDVAAAQQQPTATPPTPVAGQTPLAAVTSTPSTLTSSKESDDARYRIGPGDLLEVRIFNRPQLSLDAVRVDGRGVIRLPLLETDVQAACRTENELAQEIATQYREYQRNPQVFVFIKEYNSQPVAVIGAVEKPGRFQLQRRIRLLELLSFVGGPSDKAGLRIHVAHTGNNSACDAAGKLAVNDKPSNGKPQDEFEIFTLSETMSGNSISNPYVQPGDIVTVPEAEWAFVVGNVYKPSPIPLKMPIRLSEAIAMAGGLLPDSNTNQIRLLRQVPGTSGGKQEMFVNLREVNQRRADDPVLLAGDIVDVQTLSGRKFLRSLVTGLGPALANLPLLIIR